MAGASHQYGKKPDKFWGFSREIWPEKSIDSIRIALRLARTFPRIL
jgi:hypothetical protein